MATRLKRKLDDEDYARLPDDDRRYESSTASSRVLIPEFPQRIGE
jgi:hypothetical protein